MRTYDSEWMFSKPVLVLGPNAKKYVTSKTAILTPDTPHFVISFLNAPPSHLLESEKFWT